MGSRIASARIALAVLCFASALAAGPARAGEPSAADKETARALMEKGHAAFDAGKYKDALKPFQQAHAIMNAPTTGYWVANTFAKIGHLVEARDVAIDVARSTPKPSEPGAFAKARADADALSAELGPKIPSLEIHVEGPAEDAVHLEIDEQAIDRAALGIARKLDPGKHTIAASAQGFTSAQKDVTLAEGAHEVLTLTLEKVVDVPPDPDVRKTHGDDSATKPAPGGGTSTLVYIGFGVGAAGIVAGSITGALALSNASTAKTYCTGTACTPDAADYIDRSNSFADVSTISFGVGIAGAAVGVIALVTSGGSDAAPKKAWIQPYASPGAVGVRGAF